MWIDDLANLDATCIDVGIEGRSEMICRPIALWKPVLLLLVLASSKCVKKMLEEVVASLYVEGELGPRFGEVDAEGCRREVLLVSGTRVICRNLVLRQRSTLHGQLFVGPHAQELFEMKFYDFLKSAQYLTMCMLNRWHTYGCSIQVLPFHGLQLLCLRRCPHAAVLRRR